MIVNTIKSRLADLICVPQGDEQVAQVKPALEDQVKVVLLGLVPWLDGEQAQGDLQSTVNVPETKYICKHIC